MLVEMGESRRFSYFIRKKPCFHMHHIYLGHDSSLAVTWLLGCTAQWGLINAQCRLWMAELTIADGNSGKINSFSAQRSSVSATGLVNPATAAAWCRVNRANVRGAMYAARPRGITSSRTVVSCEFPIVPRNRSLSFDDLEISGASVNNWFLPGKILIEVVLSWEGFFINVLAMRSKT